MSRIGNKPVSVPDGVDLKVEAGTIVAKGPEGELRYEHRPEVSIEFEDEGKTVLVRRANDERQSRAYHGLTRSLIANMVLGVKTKYEKRLEIVGVGYLGAIQGDILQLRVGFANELQIKIPKELDVTCPDQTHVVVRGCDKQKVGQFAAEVRSMRKPEPYKGKGVRYQGEVVKLKPGKSAT